MQPVQLNRNENEGLYRSIFDATSDGLIVTNLETGRVVEANPAACLMHGCPREGFIGLQLIAFIHPDSQIAFSEAIQAFQSDIVFDPGIRYLRRDGSTFYTEWHGTAFTYQGQPCLLGTIRDVRKRTREEQLLRKHVETSAREQTSLLEISQILASSTEFQPELILQKLRELIEFTQGGIFILKNSTLVTLAIRGTPQLEQSPPFHIHLQGPATLATLFNDHRPIRVADMWSGDPQAQFFRSLLDEGAALMLEGIHSWMWIPLVVRGHLTGGVGIADKRKNYFTAHHADLARRIANQAGIAITHMELYQHAQELAVLEERQRLARDLHDAINQSLFSAGMIAEVIPRLWDRDQQEARRSLEELRRMMRGAQAEMRALLAELKPATLTDLSLGDLLNLLGNAFSGHNNIPVTVTTTGSFTLSTDVQIAFYRVCQEALNNIAKHAKASQVEINLEQKRAIIELRIRDNGQGFDPKQTFSGHYGLSMMRERAEAVGGYLSVTSQPGHGTELMLRWTKTPPEEAL